MSKTTSILADMPRPPGESDQSRYRGRLGAAVRKRREQLGMSVDDLVDRLETQGVTAAASSIYGYEAGNRPIPVDHLPAFAAALKTSIKKLVPEA
jgi:transcriptional regulator with XRE-family HTH domain